MCLKRWISLAVTGLSVFVLQGQGGAGCCDTPPIVPTTGAPPPHTQELPSPKPGPDILVGSTFDADNEGWAVTNNLGNTNPVWIPEGGRPGGYITTTDAKSGKRHEWYWEAPPKFLGDLSAAYGGTLSFDLGHENATSADNARDPIVILTGAGHVIAVPMPYKPGTSWTSYAFRLSPAAGWVHKETGSAATGEEILDALASLVQLQILGDYSTGLRVGQIDNVVITVGE